MKSIIIAFLLFTTLGLKATTYYISPTGSDGATGTSTGAAWQHLSYAIAHTLANDVIHVIKQGGTPYPTETTMMTLKANIVGEGDIISGYSKITCTYISTGSGDGSIQIASGTTAISISLLELDGLNPTGSPTVGGRSAITVNQHSNVVIHDCYIHDFLRWGIFMNGTSSYITGQQIYNCTINNCSDRTDPAGGNDLNDGLIRAWGYDGLVIHDCILHADGRAAGHNGNIFGPNYSSGRPSIDYAKNLHFYNNKCYHPHDDGNRFSVIMEMWDSQGGMEIGPNNEFHGGGQNIDLGGNLLTKGSSTFGFWIHDNLFDVGGQFATPPAYNVFAIQVEGDNDQVIINNNHIIGYPCGIQISLNHSTTSPGMTGVYIYNNLLEQMGYTGGAEGKAISVGPTVPTGGLSAIVSNIQMDNNTIIANGGTQGICFDIPAPVTASNFYFRNNIIKNFLGTNSAFIVIGNGTGPKSNFFIQNNIAFNDGNANNLLLRGAGGGNPAATNPSPFTNVAPIKLDPLLTGIDYHLIAGSPAIDVGTNVGRPFSGTAPDIGYLEVVAGNIPPSSNAGGPQTITQPAATVNLVGTGTDADGSISAYAWTQLSGPTSTIVFPTSASTVINAMNTTGSYVYQLKVTDNLGSTAVSTVTITVNPAVITTNQAKAFMIIRNIYKR